MAVIIDSATETPRELIFSLQYAVPRRARAASARPPWPYSVIPVGTQLPGDQPPQAVSPEGFYPVGTGAGLGRGFVSGFFSGRASSGRVGAGGYAGIRLTRLIGFPTLMTHQTSIIPATGDALFQLSFS